MPKRVEPDWCDDSEIDTSPVMFLREPDAVYHVGPVTVGSRELKTRLGAWLARVDAGERIIVTERGRPVAELRPWRPARGIDALLDSPALQGRVTRQRGGAFAAGRPVVVQGEAVSQTLIDDREDRL